MIATQPRRPPAPPIFWSFRLTAGSQARNTDAMGLTESIAREYGQA